MTETTDRKHSPTPWRVAKNLYGTANIIETEGRQIAACARECPSADLDADAKQDEANAAYIVEAVNSHARLAEDLADTNEYVTHLQDQLKHYRTMVDLVRRMIHPTETTLAFAIKEGEMVKQICRTKEAEREVDECVAALQALLKEARAAIGEEAGNG